MLKRVGEGNEKKKLTDVLTLKISDCCLQEDDAFAQLMLRLLQHAA